MLADLGAGVRLAAVAALPGGMESHPKETASFFHDDSVMTQCC